MKMRVKSTVRKSFAFALMLILILSVSTFGFTTTAYATTTSFAPHGVVNYSPGYFNEDTIGQDEVIDNAPIIGEYPDNVQKTATELAKEEAALDYYLSRVGGASSKSLLTRVNYEVALLVSQVPQDSDTWCGYAALRSVLLYTGRNYTQNDIFIASLPYNPNMPSDDDSLPWYVGSPTSPYTNIYFPAAALLNDYLNVANTYQPFGSYNSTVNVSTIKPKVMYDIDYGIPFVACGTSAGSSSSGSHLPGYPGRSIGHWLVVYGYTNYGNSVVIADPAKSPYVSWSSNISSNYAITTQKFTDFINGKDTGGAKGIIW